MKKVFDQTVRDLKREVNKKVLKVPGIEQKVLDITSNEPWGPHGSIMADIAQATRNYHEYQIIMSILWKRLNDTGKNWRHVYKALTVLEYLVGHGSERVIDDLREHAYQISTLKEFQYIDSHGRDQGQNVRKKSHALVTLLNDKERIREAREKAAVNRDKFKSASSTGGLYRPGYGGDNFEEDRYATRRDDDRNGYGREVERYRDDDRDGRNGDSAMGRDGAPRYSYGKDSGERYGRDGDNYRDEDVGGDRDNEDGRYARKTEKERDQNYDDYERGSRPSDYSPQHDKYGQKQPGGNSGAPPSYEEAVSDSSNNTNDRDKGSVESAAAKATAQYAAKSQSQNATTYTENAAKPVIKPVDEFDDFDPRNSFSATPAPNSQTEVDLFGSATELLALPAPNTIAAGVPSTENNLSADIFGNDAFTPSSSGFSNTGFAASSTSSSFSPPPPATDSQFQAGQNPFGDPPFKVSFTSDDSNTQAPSGNLPPLSFSVDSNNPHNASFNVGNQATSALDPLQPNPPNPFGEVTQPFQSSADSFQTQPPPAFPGNQHSQVPVPQPPQASFTQPPQASFTQPPQASFTQPPQASFTKPPQASFTQPPQASFTQPPQASFTQPPQASFTQPPTYSFNQVSPPPVYSQNQPQQAQPILPNAMEQKPVPAPVQRTQSLPFDLDFIQPLSSNVSTMKPQASPFMNTSTAMDISSQQKKDKFETKSAIWADTLSKGLVDLNISGPKINPLADIGIDFDSINRKEKRRGDRERTSISSVPSSNNNLPMGRAMGSGRGNAAGGGQSTSMPGSMGVGMAGGGYGMGANSAGAGMGRGMGMAGPGMGMGGNPGMGMAAPGMGMGMAQGAGMGMNMGMGMNPATMGMNPGMGMRPPMAMQPGQGVNTMMGGYGGMPGGGMNPMMGGYGSHQQPGGFR